MRKSLLTFFWLTLATNLIAQVSEDPSRILLNLTGTVKKKINTSLPENTVLAP
jgi:hypothetical protein